MREFRLLIFILAIFMTNFIFAQDFYDINSVRTIEIFFEQGNWDKILDSLALIGEERLIAKVKIDGIEYDSAGVRYKGNSSYNPNNKKNPFNIKLDYVREDQKHQGYGTLSLSNGFKDPSYLREVLGYEIARKFMPASKANWANVFINGNLHGVYMNVQDVDKFFMRTNFLSDENPRFKGELSGNPAPPLNIWGYLGADSSLYFKYYELYSDYGWNDLISFLNIFNNSPSQMEDVLNLDRHIWFLAFELLTVNLDSPVNFGHNFYLYKDDGGRYNPIIWDLNECFGVFNRLLTGGPSLTVTQMQQLTPYLNASHPSYYIVNKVLNNPAYKKRYVAHIKTMIEEVFANNWYKTRGVELQNIISSSVQADTNKFYSYNNFIANLNQSVTGGGPGQTFVGITQLMDGRINYLMSLPEFSAVAPQISDVQASTTYAQPNSTVWLNAAVVNASTVKLMTRSSFNGKFNELEMFDDGNHNDGTAGDGIYGNSFMVGSSDIQYYIFAENGSAVSFLPKKAEFEFFELEVGSEIVINEFMADNSTAVPDPHGEYDDWIELYNNTASAINLNGYFLSDKVTNLTKWTFPNVTIPPNDFLIVWADENGSQSGLHANFKLSASGEAIYLCSPDTLIIDQIIFGQQQTDISMGRYPNGTGEFIFMTPSYNAPNYNGIVNVEEENFSAKEFMLYQNYPNPFNPSTKISWQSPVSSHQVLKIFDVLGNEVVTLVDEYRKGGTYEIEFSVEDVQASSSKYPASSIKSMASGIYLYRLIAGSLTQTKKMIHLR
jgi:hypothetical protein